MPQRAFRAVSSSGIRTTLTAELSGGMANYDWKINARAYPDAQPLLIHQGQSATLTFTNTTMMWHPMHLHGHTFQVIKPDGSPGPRKDTSSCCPCKRSPPRSTQTIPASG
jgi:multicopper oxidase